MELRNVKTFIKIAEIGNFSKAATELGYAQSTVTMQIQTLERELGVSLFERNGKSAVLSAAGKEFLRIMHTTCSAVKPWRWSILRKGQIPVEK